MGTKSLITANNHLICAMDVETTGLDVEDHEIIQLGIVPLDADLQPSQDFRLLDLKIKPDNLQDIDMEALEITNIKLDELLADGLEREAALGIFEMWFESLKLPPNKKIIPLGHNILMEMSFLRKFLGGNKSLQYYFHGHVRDTMAIAAFLNDRAEFQAEQTPFPKLSLREMCKKLGVEYTKFGAHDAVYDSWMCAQVYRKLCFEFMGVV